MAQPIHAWAKEDRPREKLTTNGRRAVSNAELLAILIGSGTKEHSALDIAKQILNDVDQDLSRLSRKSIADLQKYKGIGKAKSVGLYASLELARRKMGSKQKTNNNRITCSKDSFSRLYPYFADLDREEFFIIHLNRSNVVMEIEQISIGGMSGTVADGKIIFRNALDRKSSALILAHNHPSGNIQPSESDIRLTKRLFQFGRLIDLNILDHIIVADNNYFSFADEGLLI